MQLHEPRTCHECLGTGEAEAVKPVLQEPEPEAVDDELPRDRVPAVEHPRGPEVDGRVNAAQGGRLGSCVCPLPCEAELNLHTHAR